MKLTTSADFMRDHKSTKNAISLYPEDVKALRKKADQKGNIQTTYLSQNHDSWALMIEQI